MSQTNYTPKVSMNDTQFAIEKIKNDFNKIVAKKMKLTRVSAPLFLDASLQINDNLNGYEAPVKFIPKFLNKELEVVQSLAKWKRIALKKYNFPNNKGIYTDMNAIRPDEQLDFCHSLYVDQWDWEIAIAKIHYNSHFLHHTVKKFYKCLTKLEKKLKSKFVDLTLKLPKKLFIITSKELYNLYPNLTAKERELKIVQEHKAVFISQIGGLIDGTDQIHDTRANDYDNWQLNGDLIVYHEPTESALELMSLGIRVNKKALVSQANINLEDNTQELNDYYKMIINDELPLTIGGGLGQSRLCMFLLEKKHIGEVQVSVWDDKTLEENPYIL